MVFATFCLGTAARRTSWPVHSAWVTSPPRSCSCGLILIPWAGWRFLRWNAIFSFWFAYVLTRPLGALFADYLSKDHDVSGVGFGGWQTALVLTLLVVALVGYTAKARYDIQPSGLEPAGGV